MVTNFCDTNPVADENIMANATLKELGGLVSDTPIHNIKGISKMGLPVYTTGTTLEGPRKSVPGEINVPILCDSCFIYPGDIIVGDMDGVVVVLLGDTEVILEAAQEYYMVDMRSQEEAAVGSWNREWIDRDPKVAGTKIIDGCCRR